MTKMYQFFITYSTIYHSTFMIIYVYNGGWSTMTETCILQYNKQIKQLMCLIQSFILYNRMNVLCGGKNEPKSYARR
jgi:hypothetical protein